jgi:hypothetical protein
MPHMREGREPSQHVHALKQPLSIERPPLKSAAGGGVGAGCGVYHGRAGSAARRRDSICDGKKQRGRVGRGSSRETRIRPKSVWRAGFEALLNPEPST